MSLSILLRHQFPSVRMDMAFEVPTPGVTVLFGPDVYPMHDPGTGSNYLHLFPWGKTIDAIEQSWRAGQSG